MIKELWLVSWMKLQKKVDEWAGEKHAPREISDDSLHEEYGKRSLDWTGGLDWTWLDWILKTLTGLVKRELLK